MSHPERPADDPLLRVFRLHLERQEQTLDVEPLATRLQKGFLDRSDPQAALNVQPMPRRRLWPAWTIGIGSLTLAASALLLLVFAPSAEV